METLADNQLCFIFFMVIVYGIILFSFIKNLLKFDFNNTEIEALVTYIFYSILMFCLFFDYLKTDKKNIDLNSDFYFYFYMIFLPINFLVYMLGINLIGKFEWSKCNNLFDGILIFIHSIFFSIASYFVSIGIGFDTSLLVIKNVKIYDMRIIYVLLSMFYLLVILIYGSLLFNKINSVWAKLDN